VEHAKKIVTAPNEKNAHVARWWHHINFFSDQEKAAWPADGSQSKSESKTETHTESKTEAHTEEPKKVEKKDEDDIDLFGSDDEDDKEHEEMIQRKANELAEKKKQMGIVKPIAKSAVVIDVKPWDDETDLKVMEEEVRKIVLEGLEWKASKLVPIGYGIKKLQISCHVIDDLVSVDDIQEKIEALSDYVQSTDVQAFSKL